MDDPLANLSDEEIMAIKGSRGGGRYLPPGGGGPGPGPGGGFGGSGSGFFGSQMPGVGIDGFGVWPKRRMVKGPNGDIPVSLSPLSSSQDTVPAMLSPGEFVVNRNSVAMPGVKPMLEALNMAGGGSVPGGSPAYEAGRRLGMQMRGAQGYAYGGQVRPQIGGMGTRQMPLRTPRMPAQPQTTYGTTPRQGAAPLAPTPPFVGQAPVNPGSGVNPWQDAPITPGSTNPGDEWMNRILQMLRGYGQSGAFDPGGSPTLMAALRGEATSNADALRRRAAMNADVLGLDAGQRGSYAMQTDLNTQGGVANVLNDATLKQLLGQQQFGQNMLGNMTNAQAQAWLAQLTKWMGG